MQTQTWLTHMKNLEKPKKRTVSKPKQLDLFHFFGQQRSDFSQLVDLWDQIPRFFHGRQSHLREGGKYLKNLERTPTVKGRQYRVIIKPARVDMGVGETCEFYPGPLEEQVEDALKKMGVEGCGVAVDGYYAVPCTPYQVRKYLHDHGRTYSAAQIDLALKKLNDTRADIHWEQDGQSYVLEGIKYLTFAATRTETEALKAGDTTKEQRFVVLPPFVTHSINNLTFRPYNYVRAAGYKSAAAKYLEKRLASEFKQAAPSTSFKVLASTLSRDSGLAETQPIRRQVQFWSEGLEEMKEQTECEPPAGYSVGLYYCERRYQTAKGSKRNALVDALFTVHPTPLFVEETLQANQAHKRNVAIEATSAPDKLLGQLPALPE